METEEDLFGKPKYNTKGAFVWNNVSKRFLGAILLFWISIPAILLSGAE